MGISSRLLDKQILTDESNPASLDSGDIYYDTTSTVRDALNKISNDIYYDSTSILTEVLNRVSIHNIVSDSFVLSANDITNGFVLLTHIPSPTYYSLISVIIPGGSPQYYGIDFVISNQNQFVWTGFGLSSILQVGDSIIVKYYSLS